MFVKKHNRILTLVFSSLVCSLSHGSMAHAQSTSVADRFAETNFRQFDFWRGEWNVNLRMIQKDLTWKDSVKAKVQIFSVLDGKAILELWDSKPIKGFSLRYFDPAEKKWILYLCWPSAQYSSISSLKGSFRHGRGEFFSKFNGTLSRYTFSDITPNSLRWDDAFSKDDGKTWTNNWIMEFSRTAPKAEFPQVGEKSLTYETGNRSPHSESRLFERLAGSHKSKPGKEFELDGQKIKSTDETTLRCYKILDGCAVMSFLHSPQEDGLREFSLVTFNPMTKNYEELVLDNRSGSTARKLIGTNKNGKVTFLEKDKLQRSWSFDKKSATLSHAVWNDRLKKYLLTRHYVFGL